MKKLLPTPLEIKESYPLAGTALANIQASREKASRICQNQDPSIAIILGPCSIHEHASAIEYAEYVLELQKRHPSFFFICRVFVEKARTTIGWKGLIYDPDLNGSESLSDGICQTRKLFLRLAEMGVPTATEFVDPIIAPYFSDLVTWGCIGARTSSSQPHRQFASSLNFPVGFKNAVDGNLEVAVQGALSSTYPHSFASINNEGRLSQEKTGGNPFSHIILRGSVDKTNYDASSISLCLQSMKKNHFQSKIIVDCSHGNSNRIAERQVISFQNVIEQILAGNNAIMGLMLESYIHTGKQSLTPPLKYGVSVTDSCLGMDETSELIASAEETLFSPLTCSL